MRRAAVNDVSPRDRLKARRDGNKALADHRRELHGVTDEAGDCSTTSLLEEWIDQSERRTWFLYETTRDATQDGH